LWLTAAANQGHPAAQYYLGLMYENGDGVIKDTAKALTWYQQAANQGYLKAKDKLKTIAKEQSEAKPNATNDLKVKNKIM
jgi:TPR repeat protein